MAKANIITYPYDVIDTTADDSDKTVTLSNRQGSTLIAIRVKYVASATVATRQVALELQNPDGTVIYKDYCELTQTASQTRYYQWGVGLTRDTSFRGPSSDEAHMPLPPFPMEKGSKVRIYDTDGTAVAEDDVSLYLKLAWS